MHLLQDESTCTSLLQYFVWQICSPLLSNDHTCSQHYSGASPSICRRLTADPWSGSPPSFPPGISTVWRPKEKSVIANSNHTASPKCQNYIDPRNSASGSGNFGDKLSVLSTLYRQTKTNGKGHWPEISGGSALVIWQIITRRPLDRLSSGNYVVDLLLFEING